MRSRGGEGLCEMERGRSSFYEEEDFKFLAINIR